MTELAVDYTIVYVVMFVAFVALSILVFVMFGALKKKDSLQGDVAKVFGKRAFYYFEDKKFGVRRILRWEAVGQNDAYLTLQDGEKRRIRWDMLEFVNVKQAITDENIVLKEKENDRFNGRAEETDRRAELEANSAKAEAATWEEQARKFRSQMHADSERVIGHTKELVQRAKDQRQQQSTTS